MDVGVSDIMDVRVEDDGDRAKTGCGFVNPGSLSLLQIIQ